MHESEIKQSRSYVSKVANVGHHFHVVMIAPTFQVFYTIGGDNVVRAMPLAVFAASVGEIDGQPA